MSAITFLPEIGGSIEFQYDSKKYYAVSQYGTSVPLWEGELVFVPRQKCSCADSCTAQESHFSAAEIIGCLVPPVEEGGDIQPYAGKHSCWVRVQLFDQDMVDAACPSGFTPAIATNEGGVYHVHEFLWT